MKPLYSIGDYDKQLTLKIGQNLWLILLFLLSPYIVIMLSLSNRKNAMELINSIYPDRLDMALAAVVAIPVGFVIYALLTKKPTSTDFVRRIWRNGRKILIFSAALKIIFIFSPSLLETERKFEIISWIHVALSVITLAYLLLTQRVKDVFKDFPQAQDQ